MRQRETFRRISEYMPGYCQQKIKKIIALKKKKKSHLCKDNTI